MRFLNDDGSLLIEQWATKLDGGKMLAALPGPGPQLMYGTSATAKALVSNGFLGVDLIQLPAGGGFSPHTHPGDHLLVVVKGEGTITYDGRIYPTEAGQVYCIEGSVPHAVGARTDHAILAVGAPHRPADGADRMALVEYRNVASDLGELHCLICDVHGDLAALEAAGCEHRPVFPADPMLPLVVGIAPASANHVGKAAFSSTKSGNRLAQLLGVAPDDLLSSVDTVNLSTEWVEDWQAVPEGEWKKLGTQLRSRLAGRVVIACGRTVASALGAAETPWNRAQRLDTGMGRAPALLLTIPHPSGLSRAWNVEAVAEEAARALKLVRTLSATGSPRGDWSDEDASLLNEAILHPASD